jgi:hypothetical protein
MNTNGKWQNEMCSDWSGDNGYICEKQKVKGDGHRLTTPLQPRTTVEPGVSSVMPYTTCVNGDFREFCTKAFTASLLYQTGTETKDDVYVLISGIALKSNDRRCRRRDQN